MTNKPKQPALTLEAIARARMLQDCGRVQCECCTGLWQMYAEQLLDLAEAHLHYLAATGKPAALEELLTRQGGQGDD